MRWFRRAIITVCLLNVALFSWSIYRRIWQVLRLDLRVSSPVLAAGTRIMTDVITTGEVDNIIRLELVQGAHAQTLLERTTHITYVRSYDPRLWRYTPEVVVTPALLSRFAPGPAIVRLTGVGRQKLLRTPPPRVTEIAVTIPAK